MRGHNEITLNQATMLAALQHYFTTVVFQTGVPVKVKAVAEIRNPGAGCFTVKFDGAEAPAAPPAMTGESP